MKSVILGRIMRPNPRRRLKDNINRVLQEVRCEDVDWIEMAHDRDS
jgi:hypothetical protein